MIHHVSIITSKLHDNVNFYVNVLGMTFVKKTVNFDDPFTYHLYYGNSSADEGSIVTFFVHPNSQKGKKGKGVAHGMVLEVPYEIHKKLGDKINDPDGLLIKLKPGKDYKILGVITTASKEFHDKFSLDSESEFLQGNDYGVMGAGIIHHTAFSVQNVNEQKKFREKIIQHNPSPIIDRFYFKSIYFQEPNGCLIEVATNGPGFFIDEVDKTKLGKKLMLPPQYEEYRNEIETRLPEL